MTNLLCKLGWHKPAETGCHWHTGGKDIDIFYCERCTLILNKIYIQIKQQAGRL